MAAVGACVAPLICQTLLARGISWAHFYLGSLVLSALNTTLLSLAFRVSRNESTDEQERNLALTLRFPQPSIGERSSYVAHRYPDNVVKEKTDANANDTKKSPNVSVNPSDPSASSPARAPVKEKEVSGQLRVDPQDWRS